jgi:hypothetical protein
MPRGYIIILTKNFHPIRLECGHIVYSDFYGTSEPQQYVFLQELDDDCVSRFLRGDSLYPFHEIVGGREYPFVLRGGWWIYFSYEIKTPPHERSFN